jgi:hypothetical protein
VTHERDLGETKLRRTIADLSPDYTRAVVQAAGSLAVAIGAVVAWLYVGTPEGIGVVLMSGVLLGAAGFFGIVIGGESPSWREFVSGDEPAWGVTFIVRKYRMFMLCYGLFVGPLLALGVLLHGIFR